MAGFDRAGGESRAVFEKRVGRRYALTLQKGRTGA